MKKIVVFTLVLLCLFYASCKRADTEVNTQMQRRYTYLFAGLDNVASNTDVLFLLSYDPSFNSATVLQIPRDTFCSYGGTDGKINRIVPYLLSRGMSKSEAMRELDSYLEDSFGIKTDGYACFDLDGFRDVVDVIGGIDISLEKDFVIYDEHGVEQFTIGSNTMHLDGKMAEAFVRFRKGYATGDLGRMDAQKVFIDAFVKSIKNNVGFDEAVNLMFTVGGRITTDISLMDTARLLLQNRERLSDVSLKYVTIPGEATAYKGVSYYIINRKSAAEILSGEFGAETASFDRERRFTSNAVENFDDIYDDGNFSYKYFNTGKDSYVQRNFKSEKCRLQGAC